jgi:tetratricopeptide (TPR) repeat protein
VALLSAIGRADRAKAVVGMFDRERASVSRFDDERIRHHMLGDIAMAERRYEDAQREYRDADRGPCTVCILPRLASAYDLAGERDSAVAIFTRYLETPDAFRFPVQQLSGAGDAEFLAISNRRLGELWEQKGDRQKALVYYLRFVDLWKNADPELQPKVAEVRRRIARIQDTERR